MSAETIALLRKARGYVEQGWTRGTSKRASRVCAVGACRQAENGDAWVTNGADMAAGALQAQLNREADGRYVSLPGFNDEQKSKRPVLALFDRTIARLESELARG